MEEELIDSGFESGQIPFGIALHKPSCIHFEAVWRPSGKTTRTKIRSTKPFEPVKISLSPLTSLRSILDLFVESLKRFFIFGIIFGKVKNHSVIHQRASPEGSDFSKLIPDVADKAAAQVCVQVSHMGTRKYPVSFPSCRAQAMRQAT